MLVDDKGSSSSDYPVVDDLTLDLFDDFSSPEIDYIRIKLHFLQLGKTAFSSLL